MTFAEIRALHDQMKFAAEAAEAAVKRRGPWATDSERTAEYRIAEAEGECYSGVFRDAQHAWEDAVRRAESPPKGFFARLFS